MSKKKKANSGRLVWFEIPADDIDRAKKFYSKLFGWKIKKFPDPMEYWQIDTGAGDGAVNGGMMKRQHPQHGVTNYISVPSVNRYMAKVEKLGGQICMPKTAVPQMGYFAVCRDLDNNTFAIWEMDEKAKSLS
jgi:predicted enzyme related to lactoylglutathione lyase